MGSLNPHSILEGITMKFVSAFIASVVGLCSSVVLAQPYIEFHVQGQVHDSVNQNVVHVEYRMVFDTSAPPSLLGTTVNFEPVLVEAIQSGMSASTSPLVLQDPVVIDPDSPANRLLYDFATGELVIQTLLDQLRISHPVGDFHSMMTSLPDHPNDYALDLNEPGASITLVAGFFNQIGWTPSQGFYDATPNNRSKGSFTTSIQLVENPNTEQCDADFNNDGSLNFLDISAYLQLYGEGCP
tara:strand:- start:2287 stop:3009 length:723 start_codon:yes stop_codon:yes gene_type:complete